MRETEDAARHLGARESGRVRKEAPEGGLPERREGGGAGRVREEGGRKGVAGGVPLPELLPKGRIAKLVQRTKVGGGELVSLLGTSAWYAPGAAAAQMVDSICLDEKRVLPCTAYLEGEYGIDGLYMGVPVVLGAGGIERIVELDLDESEQAALRASADAVREVVAVLAT